MAGGCHGFASAYDHVADAPGAGTLVRSLALEPGMDRLGHCGSPRAGSTHHRPVGRRLRRGWTCRLDIRAVRGFPPALGETQQAELKEAVQELPEAADIGLANWNWKVVHQFVSERFGLSLSRSSCLDYPRFHGVGVRVKFYRPSTTPMAEINSPSPLGRGLR